MALANYIPLLLALTATLSAQPDRHGLPACDASNNDELADRTYFILCHSASRKVPTWVGYELKPEHLAADPAASRPHNFRRDTALTHAGARDADYRNSGYSRGHLAPARDFAFSSEALRATFLLSNAAPQLQSTNAGLWARLERSLRNLAATADVVYIYSGPIFEGPTATIGEGRIAVPSHFYKVALVESNGLRTMYAAIIPNGPTHGESLAHFLATVHEVEQRTGLNFFAALDPAEQHALESAHPVLPD